MTIISNCPYCTARAGTGIFKSSITPDSEYHVCIKCGNVLIEIDRQKHTETLAVNWEEWLKNGNKMTEEGIIQMAEGLSRLLSEELYLRDIQILRELQRLS